MTTEALMVVAMKCERGCAVALVAGDAGSGEELLDEETRMPHRLTCPRIRNRRRGRVRLFVKARYCRSCGTGTRHGVAQDDRGEVKSCVECGERRYVTR